MGLENADTAKVVGQFAGFGLVQRRDWSTDAQFAPLGHVRGAEAVAAERGEAAESDGSCARRDFDVVVTDGTVGDNRAWGKRRESARDGIANDYKLGSEEKLGETERIGDRAVVERSHQVAERVGRLGEVERRRSGRSIPSTEVAGVALRLCRRSNRSGSDLDDEFGEGADGRHETPCVQRERGVASLDGDDALLHDGTRIDRRGDFVERDAVTGFAVHERPARGMEARVLRQRRVVEVDGLLARSVQNLGGNDPRIVQAEQVVVRLIEKLEAKLLERRKDPQPLLDGGGIERMIRGMDAQNLDSRSHEVFGARVGDTAHADDETPHRGGSDRVGQVGLPCWAAELRAVPIEGPNAGMETHQRPFGDVLRGGR